VTCGGDVSLHIYLYVISPVTRNVNFTWTELAEISEYKYEVM
jgi:hypothetical protein